MAKFVRDSSYRHVVVSLHRREQWYEALNTTSTASDCDLLASSSSFLAYVDNGGGGCVLAVLPHSSYGKNHVPITASTYRQPLIRAHSQAITDFAFDRFAESRIATCSTDGYLKLWEVPSDGLVEDLSTPVVSLSTAGNAPLRGLSFHPSASNVAALRTARDVLIADLVTGTIPLSVAQDSITADITSLAWSYPGDLLLTAGKDKMLRILDPRGNCVAAEQLAHDNIRGAKAIWAGSSGLVITTGYSATVDREMCLWDPRALTSPIQRERVDSSSGLLLPFFEPDAKLLFVVGRGDTSMRLYELDAAALHPINCVTAGDVMRGATLVPRHGLDRAGNEVARLLKLTDKCIQPVRYEVPRRERLRYSADLYPPTVHGSAPALSSEQWFGGETALPVLTPMEAPNTKSSNLAALEAEEKSIPEPAETKAAEDSPRTLNALAAKKAFGQLLKYRHVYGRENSKERTFFNLQPDTSAMDSPLITCNEFLWAVPYVGGGGPVYVSTMSCFGKVEPACAVINGHRAVVTDLCFSPFDPYLLATGSDDTHICLWRVPEEGITTSLLVGDALADLSGHGNAVRTVNFHPIAQGVLVTSSMDLTIRVWDIAAQSQALCLRGGNTDSLNNVSFSIDGSLLATGSKDRTARVIDPRAGDQCVAFSTPEVGRNLRVQWCTSAAGSSLADPLLTVSSGAGGARALHLWDPRAPTTPICTRSIDSASGQLFPMYDEDTGLCYIAGKGDTTVRFFELGKEATGEATATKANEFQTSSTPITGICMLPKRTCNVRELEVSRFLKLSTDAVIPVSFTLPRAEALKGYFQDDVFVPTRSAEPALQAVDWLSGANALPVRQSLKPDNMPNLSEKPVEEPKRASTKIFRDELDKAEKEAQQRDAAFNRLQQMAITRSKYHPNQSMGPVGIPGVDQKPQHDDDDDDGWDD